uniref:Synaptobrevin, longin-like domain protein n=1 Tax=Tanacetum cinerariifolium TaxID=118510 RepID=A0A699HFW7_TANCI|nr:hypothetical protein [Tanacetum cinerariifolium]
MVAILEKTEHNTDFHQIVDFLEASHIKYALTISPTVYIIHIRQFWSTARIETTNQETNIIATVDGKLQNISESSLRRHLKLNDEEEISSLPDAELFENLSLMGYNILPNQSNIATVVVCLATNRVYNISKMIFDGMVRNINNEHVSLLRDDKQGEAFPTVSSLDVEKDKENIAKTSALPHESSPMVISLDADEGSMQQRIHELMELCTSLQRKQSQMAAKIKDQDQEISKLKARVKFLENKESRSAEPTQEDALITWGIMEIREELGADKSTELGSNDTKEMVNVLSLMEAANILTSRGASASVSPGDVFPTVGVPTVSGSFPTPMQSPIIRAKDRGKEKVIESEVPKKRKLQEQIDSQVAREMSNEVIAKHLREYEQAKADLSVSKPLTKKEQKEFYMSVLRSHAGWKTKHFRGMTLETIKEKFISVWKQLEDFVPMSSEEESERVTRQGLKIDQGSTKRMKISEGASEEELKGMMQLVPLEEVYIEALQVKHPIID